MNNTTEKLFRKVIIKSESGLHARPSSMIAKIAQKAKSKVWLEKNDQKVEADSIIDILTLECSKNSEITILVEDEADIKVMEEIAKLIESDFDN